MSWNFRVMRYRVSGQQPAPQTHGIHEVYYDEVGVVRGWTERPVSLTAFDVDDLRRRAMDMLKAFDHPVLDYGDEPPPSASHPERRRR